MDKHVVLHWPFPLPLRNPGYAAAWATHRRRRDNRRVVHRAIFQLYKIFI